MKIKFKKLSDKAVAPQIMRSGDCGADLTATSITETDMYIEYGTDLAVIVPENHVGILAPRSSLSNYDLTLSNSIGIIDQNYRGELKFRFKKTRTWDDFGEYHPVGPKYYQEGDRVGQLLIVPLPVVEYEEVQELDETNRGANGFGSSNI